MFVTEKNQLTCGQDLVITTVDEAEVKAYINQLDPEEEQRKLKAALTRQQEQHKQEQNAELQIVQKIEQLHNLAIEYKRHIDSGEWVLKYTESKWKTPAIPKPTSKLISSTEYRRNAANALVSHAMYQIVDVGSDPYIPEYKRQYLGYGRITLSDNGELVDIRNRKKFPERYLTKEWEGFVNRARTIGRPGEVIVKTYLDLAGVVNYLQPMVLDGDMDNPSVDIVLESPPLNEYGTFDLAGYDVKVHYHEYFTNSPSTFPKELRVEKVHAFDRKMSAATQRALEFKEETTKEVKQLRTLPAREDTRRNYTFKGTIHYSRRGGGVLFIPNSTEDKWNVRPVNRDGYPKDEYFAPRECLYPLAELVKWYTLNTPELRKLMAQQEGQAELEDKLAAYCF